MKNAINAVGWLPAAAGGRSDRSVTAVKSNRFQLCEYAYYFIVFYALMGSAVGISMGSLGIAMHLALALLCVFSVRSGALALYRPLTSIILASVGFVIVQVLVHGSSLTNVYIRPFLSFLLALIIVKSLYVRPGFLRRASVAIFIIGLTVLPFLDLNRSAERAGLSAGVLANANDLAYWFGFCAVAFLVRGLESRGTFSRWMSLGIALFSLYMVGLTVGRGTLAAFTVATVIAGRKQMKRGFLPVLGVVVLAGGAFAYGLFDQAIQRYIQRGVEETGRTEVWPLIVQRVLEAPLSGVPASEFGTTLISGYDITPHNGLLLIALGGGVVPLLFFLRHWARCVQGAVASSLPRSSDVPYLLPLLVYAFLIMMQASESFISTWSEVVVCGCLHNLAVHQRTRLSALKSRLLLRGRARRGLVTSKF